MKIIDVNKKFTDKVAEYISKGYIINSNSMAGHQGEVGKVDLVKGDDFIRVWMERGHVKNWVDRDAYHGYILYIRVGRWKYPARRSFDSWTTVWISDCEVFEEYALYENSGATWYYESMEEAMAAQEARKFRTRSHYYPSITQYVDCTDEAREIASRYMKRKQGYQRVSKDHLKVTKSVSKDGPHYWIHYRDQSFMLK